ncbi:MAG: histidine kinase N-terminal 7TM domain-containing protein [Anaerolineae bacterium]|nr:histidine kinase N-terminal 7TM domain-containing protein [Anaerolineae bacterium]
MIFQYTLFITLAPIAIVVNAAILLYTLKHRARHQFTTLTWLIISILGWLTLNSLELIAQSPEWTELWAKISYVFIAISPVFWLAFALQYTGHASWLPRKRLWLVFVIPVATIVIAFSNPYHHLLWQSYNYVPINNMLAMHVVHGPWFWVFAIYSYLLIYLGAAVIAQQYFKPFTLYRRQSMWLLLGALAPVVMNIVYLFDLLPGLQKDYTTLSFALAGIAFAADIYLYHLFDLRPIARDIVIDSMSDAMITVDAQDRIVDMNPAALELRSLGTHLAFGKSLEPFFEQANVFYLPTGQSTFQQDIKIRLSEIDHYYDLRSMPVKDRQGHLTGRLFILRDNSERKGVELALRQQTDELEVQNRELDAFAHTVAHDLKGPMGTIVGYASMLHEVYLHMPEEEFLESLDGIITTTVRMSQIVDSLLLLSQVRKLEDVPNDAMDMGTIVIRALDHLNDTIADAGARLVLPPNWPFAMGYAPWVEEVWVNYIHNAVKYGGRPELGIAPVIELGWDAQDSHQDAYLRFWVRDNGVGLSVEERDRLFVEFTRLDHQVTSGHGLGLSIVKRILDKLGGSVGVDTKHGTGNTFYFTLAACKFD